MTSVLAAAAWDPGAHRIEIDLPEGLTLADIVATALPGASDDVLAGARVALVTSAGAAIVLRQHWSVVRPRPGVRVVIRVIPRGDSMRAVLSIVVSIAAVALASTFSGPLMGVLGVSKMTASALIGLGVTIVGNLLINALIPPVTPDTERKASYSITGWKNRLDPNAAVPFPLGTIRYAPPFAARPYTEIVGDLQYVRTLFVVGEGECEISDLRIGETSIADFDEVEIETRAGIEGDLPITLYPRQVVEEQIGVELTRPLPRNDDGSVKTITETVETPWAGGIAYSRRTYNAPAEETPIVRTTGPDAAGASIIFAFPGGLVRYDDKGRRQWEAVSIRVEQRLVADDDWTEVTVLSIGSKKAEAFYRQHTWDFPSRGRWQVRLTMMTDESDDSKITRRTTWAALQTLRPEYPLSHPRPLALIALRIKATHQINGGIDNVNCMVSRVSQDWDAAAGEWVRRTNQSPAAAYREVLQHLSNPKAVSSSGLNLALLQDWSDWCVGKGLTYNRVLDATGTTLRDVLTEIAAAGRATPRHDGTQWGVVIDRPVAAEAALVIDHITPRNSWSFRSSRAYINPPHAFVVTFQDAGNDYIESQRIVRWPGYTGEITLTEELTLPGKVHAAEVWREARRRQLETIHRPDTYEVTQDGSVRVVTRGDDVMLSHYILDQTQAAARVRDVQGQIVLLDDLMTIETGTNYALRWRVHADELDLIGTSVVRTCSGSPGQTDVLIVDDPSMMPAQGDLVLIGPVSAPSYHQVVTSIEVTADQCSIVRTVDAAPQIDTILDATEVPAWSSRVGAELEDGLLHPTAPRFAAVSSGVSGASAANEIVYILEPGSGAVTPVLYRVEHRLQGSAVWTPSFVPVASGGGTITSYSVGGSVQIRACAVSISGAVSPYTPVVTIVVGSGDAGIPGALDADDINVTTLLGGALVEISIGDDAVKSVQVYRSLSATTVDMTADAVGDPLTVTAGQTYSIALGDTSRTSRIVSGGMDDPDAWGLGGTGWLIADGIATHAPGVEGWLVQNMSFQTGKVYRIGYTISGRTAGTITPSLRGSGLTLSGVSAAGNGTFRDAIESGACNRVEFRSSADFDGSIDDIVLYMETAACLSAGSHYIWIEPRNADGIPGPVSGPYLIEVI